AIALLAGSCRADPLRTVDPTTPGFIVPRFFRRTSRVAPTPDYPPALTELLRDRRLNAPGPGTPNAAARPLLRELTVPAAFAPHPVSDGDMARACLAGLWLYHDFLDESHQISQEIDTPTGSYWHGLMHRREPDYGNAAYWFRRVRAHPIFADLR